MAGDYKSRDGFYISKEWQYKEITDKQRNYINFLVEKYPGYKLFLDLDLLCRGEISQVINDLCASDIEWLVKKKILTKVYTKEEFISKVKDDLKNKK